jgi:hypothetical protein
MNPETKIQNECRLEAGKTDGVLMYRKQVGKYRHINFPEQVVTIGLPGQADTTLMVEVEITPEMVGKRIAIGVEVEFKTPTGRQSGVQKNWQRAVESIAGKYYIIRSREEFTQLISNIKRGILWD